MDIRRSQYAEGANCQAWFALGSAPVDGVELCRTISTGAKPPLERRCDECGTLADPAAPPRNATSIARLRAAFKDIVGVSSDTVEERFLRGKLEVRGISC